MKYLTLLFLCSFYLFNAEIYNVGPGQTYTNIGDVPLVSLVAGDQVHVHWRSEPYYEKFVINAEGTEEAPIVFRGVAGVGGERPVIDGDDAVTSLQFDYWGENRGLIKIGGSSAPSNEIPKWIVVEGFELRNAHSDNVFTDDNGNNGGNYAGNAACVYIEIGQDILIKDNVIHGCGNGIFAGINGGNTQRLTVEANHIYGNGNVGSYLEHNSYMSSVGITYKYNHYGPLCEGCDGNNLKDRSSGVVVMNNWIESGNRQLDLVDEEVATEDDSYHTTYIFGNLLIEDMSGNRQIIHYGGDSGNTANYRKGTCYIYHNTIISTRTDKFTLILLSSEGESADIRNNIIYAPSVSEIEIFSEHRGQVILRSNLINSGWKESISSSGSGSLEGSGNIDGDNPMFVNFGAQDFHLETNSPAYTAGEIIDSNLPPVNSEYVVHTSYKGRCPESTPSIGSYSGTQGCAEETEETGGISNTGSGSASNTGETSNTGSGSVSNTGETSNTGSSVNSDVDTNDSIDNETIDDSSALVIVPIFIFSLLF